MDISFFGQSSFKIKGKNASIITDPFSSTFIGLKFPKTEADIVTISHNHEDHNFWEGVSGDPFIVSEQGEYEIKGISVMGYPSFHDDKSGEELGTNIIYVIEIDGMRICHLGDLGGTLPAKTVEEVDGVDILMIPVGGKYTIGPKEAVEVVGQIEPLIIIPMHYKLPGLKVEIGGVEEFLTQMGSAKSEKLDKLSLSRDKMPQETKVIVLEKKD